MSAFTSGVRSSGRRGMDFSVIALCCVPLAAFTIYLIAHGFGAYRDFTAYWGAARVFLVHQNPYAQHPLLGVQRSVGWPEAGAIRAYNPPWALPLFAPIGWLPFSAAQFVWLMLALAIEGGAAALLWSYFGGEARLR